MFEGKCHRSKFTVTGGRRPSAIAQKVRHASVQSLIIQYCNGTVGFIGYNLEHRHEKAKLFGKKVSKNWHQQDLNPASIAQQASTLQLGQRATRQ